MFEWWCWTLLSWIHVKNQLQFIPLGVQTRCPVTTKRGGIGWEVGGWFQRVETYVYLWLIHVDVW